MQGTDKKPGYQTAGTLLLGFAVLYFLFPVLFIWPFALLGMSTPPMLLTLFTPVSYLYDHVPPYQALIDRELKLLGMR